jgi:energy-coupling factor transporter ATP-binding protein EcfA2
MFELMMATANGNLLPSILFKQLDQVDALHGVYDTHRISIVQHPLIDEPTNHLDMESIESLNTAVEKFAGTVIFVSHDRELVSSLTTRIIDGGFKLEVQHP